MYTVDLYLRVRLACHVDGLSQREAASRFGIARETVRKMLRHSEPPGYRRRQPPKRPKLAPFTDIIDRILEEDRPVHRLIPSGAETPVFWAPQRLALLVAPTRRDDLKLSRGATAKLRENAVKQDHVQATNTIGITWKGRDFHAGRN